MKHVIDHHNVIGLVDWFNDAKGYGFLSIGEVSGDGTRKVKLGQIFAHYTSITGDGFKTLAEDQEVEFDLYLGAKGPTAVNIRKAFGAA